MVSCGIIIEDETSAHGWRWNVFKQGIAACVDKAWEALNVKNYEEGLKQICSAVEATAKKEGRSKKRQGYMDFIRDNMPLIGSIAFSPVEGVRIVFSHPELPADAAGTVGLEDIVYHSVRCGLYHSSELPNYLRIVDGSIGTDPAGKILLLPFHLVTGLVVAVVASPANAGLDIDPDHWFTYHGREIRLREIRGKRDELLAELIALRAKSLAGT
jgi:hypothetical protein